MQAEIAAQSWQCLIAYIQPLLLAKLHAASQLSLGAYRIQDVYIDTGAIIGVLVLAI